MNSTQSVIEEPEFFLSNRLYSPTVPAPTYPTALAARTAAIPNSARNSSERPEKEIFFFSPVNKLII